MAIVTICTGILPTTGVTPLTIILTIIHTITDTGTDITVDITQAATIPPIIIIIHIALGGTIVPVAIMHQGITAGIFLRPREGHGG